MKMSTCFAFHSRLTSIMDQLTKVAITEICGLVDDSYALLHSELTRSKKEIEVLKEKLHVIEPRIAGGYAEGTGCSGDETPLLKERKLAEEFVSAAAEGEISLICHMPVDVRRDGAPSSSDKDARPGQFPGCKSLEMVEERPDMIIIKKEGMEEDVETSDPPGGLNVTEERAVDLGGGGERSPISDTQTRHLVWEDGTPSPVLKAEPEDETINLQQKENEIIAGRLNRLSSEHVSFDIPSQLDTFYTRGNSETETEGPVCFYTAKNSSENFTGHSEMRLGVTTLKEGGKSSLLMGNLVFYHCRLNPLKGRLG
ncbi:hypothetical protein GJAV_G00095240 [Gymnothorax javanicus]|nr:hypothetical protein GJAV_G00095240 [Gymnothorax javanicus]